MKTTTPFISTCCIAATAIMLAFSASAVELRGSHKANNVPCKACHVDGMSKPGKMAGCLSCHQSYEAVRALTANKPGQEVNPHMDGHMGELDCTECHHMHKPSQAVCNDCHQFDFVTP